ncbi:MAG TPA: translation initiation factor [Chitinophagaceae bacterium]|nr:translation initiation factor [Chitinophagaceae bacterium]
MSKKNKPDARGFVFSTDPNFSFEENNNAPAATLPPKQQVLRIRLDTKHRAGKAVTLITGFTGLTEDLEQLGKQLKNYCGSGGAVKEGDIIVQGDHRDKVLQWLHKNGYTAAKKV